MREDVEFLRKGEQYGCTQTILGLDCSSAFPKQLERKPGGSLCHQPLQIRHGPTVDLNSQHL